MTKKRHKPPSRIRYQENNPTVSVRMPRAWKEEFNKYLKETHLTAGDFFRIAFRKQKKNYKKVRSEVHQNGLNEGFHNGYEKARKNYRIWYYCAFCKKEIDLLPNSNEHRDIIEYIKEKGWIHETCAKRRQSQGVQPPYEYHRKDYL
ncbi:hypothetical protein AYK25_03430 [Thermoplasmatales archaeon SM1-50]|nr:MAG: hypothetical protein AYK25_03430 [Thermoplasmatales archaeon SM1-50]